MAINLSELIALGVFIVGVLGGIGSLTWWLAKHVSEDERTRQKLEDHIREADRRQSVVDTLLQAGVLPRTDERLRAIEHQLDAMRRNHGED